MGKEIKIGPWLYYKLTDSEFRKAVNVAFEYALLSISFTINRMNLNNLEKRILNITKGKLAEIIFKEYCTSKGLSLDFSSCETPFYQNDKRDFLWKQKEWDLKNNFLACQNTLLTKEKLNELPALVPSKNEYDQWAKRQKKYFNTSTDVGFVFSFMVGKLENGPLLNDLISISFTKDQQVFLEKVYNKFNGNRQNKKPFEENAFLNKWHEISIPTSKPTIEIGFNSPIYITGFASKGQWPLFQNCPPSTFAQGKFRTRINNSYCAVNKLPSFASVMAS